MLSLSSGATVYSVTLCDRADEGYLCTGVRNTPWPVVMIDIHEQITPQYQFNSTVADTLWKHPILAVGQCPVAAADGADGAAVARATHHGS